MANLEDALLTQKEQTKQEVPSLSGMLGIPLDGQRLVEVPNRNSYVYVRLRSNQSEVIQAYNNQVAIAYNLPVLVERQGNRYVVLGVDSQRYENNWASFAPFLPRHGNTHSFDIESGGGGDIVWVYPRQFTPVLVMPSGSVGAGSVIVNPYTLQKPNGSWLYVGNTGTPSLLPYRPTSATGAVIALIYLNANTGNPGYIINSGTVFSNTITGSSQIAPYIPTLTGTFQIPLAAVRLITGTSAISWDNIYDLRQFLHPMPTGTGGGSSGGDSTYLRLDTANDPLTNTLHISTLDSTSLDIAQTGMTSGSLSSPVFIVSRGDTVPYVHFDGAAIRVNDNQNNLGTVFGPVLFYSWNSQSTLSLNPSDKYFLGTTYSVNNSNPILEINNFGSSKFIVYGNGNVNIPTGQTYNVGGGPHTHHFLLPFNVYEAPSVPITVGPLSPYVVPLDRTIIPVRWSNSFYVVTTNNGSNYWKFELIRLSDATVVATLDTSAASADSWQSVVGTTFSNIPYGTADKGLYIHVTKVNSPGNLYYSGPIMEVQV